MMKKIITATLFIAFIGLTSCEKETILKPNEIQSEISTYVTTHFPNHKILYVVKDVDGLKRTYDVLLENNISLEFNRKNEIIGIEAHTQLPESVIPPKINDYVKVNFVSNFITQWELDDRHQKVGLNNDIDLKFKRNGDFIKIDL